MTISPAVRLPLHPFLPVAQKLQPMRQPDCTETHTVILLPSGSQTVSKGRPEAVSKRYLTEPSADMTRETGAFTPVTNRSSRADLTFTGMSSGSLNDLMPRL